MEGRDSLGDVSIRGKGVAKDTKKAAKMDIEMYMMKDYYSSRACPACSTLLREEVYIYMTYINIRYNKFTIV